MEEIDTIKTHNSKDVSSPRSEIQIQCNFKFPRFFFFFALPIRREGREFQLSGARQLFSHGK